MFPLVFIFLVRFRLPDLGQALHEINSSLSRKAPHCPGVIINDTQGNCIHFSALTRRPESRSPTRPPKANGTEYDEHHRCIVISLLIPYKHGKEVMANVPLVDIGCGKCNTRIFSGLLLPVGPAHKSCQYQWSLTGMQQCQTRLHQKAMICRVLFSDRMLYSRGVL